MHLNPSASSPHDMAKFRCLICKNETNKTNARYTLAIIKNNVRIRMKIKRGQLREEACLVQFLSCLYYRVFLFMPLKEQGEIVRN